MCCGFAARFMIFSLALAVQINCWAATFSMAHLICCLISGELIGLCAVCSTGGMSTRLSGNKLMRMKEAWTSSLKVCTQAEPSEMSPSLSSHIASKAQSKHWSISAQNTVTLNAYRCLCLVYEATAFTYAASHFCHMPYQALPGLKASKAHTQHLS